MTFSKKSYILMGVGVLLIALGFITLMGGGVSDPTKEFSYEIFSFRRLWVAPILLVLGFGLEIFAILFRFDK